MIEKSNTFSYDEEDEYLGIHSKLKAGRAKNPYYDIEDDDEEEKNIKTIAPPKEKSNE